MKKSLCMFLTAILLCLSGCNGHEPDDAVAPTTETSLAEDSQLPMPGETAEFSFLSGAGGWRTVMTLNRDGEFTGLYLDSEMGEIGEGYPMGSVYICEFSGKFGNIEQIDAYSYKMTLTDVATEKAVGEAWIEEGIRYVASDPHGLNDPVNMLECTEFVFYLPDTPVDQVPEEFLIWWPYRYTQETEPKATLSCYGILNVTTNFGFFTTE